MKTQPLVRLLTDAGYGSRRKVANLVKAGAVQVNNRLASSFTEPVDIERDSVSVSGQHVGPFKPQRFYLMMHKPPGVLSTTEDDRGRQTVMDLLPEKYRQAGLYPAGRLDEDSTGLLILTNDGDLTHELTHPRFEHEKEYNVTVGKPLADEAFRALEAGVEIEGQVTWPARVHAIKESQYDGECIYSVTIHEGRKRQVRRMFQALGYDVMSLKRVRTGSLVLGPLQEGEFRELSEKELKVLMRRGGAPQDMRDTQSTSRTAVRRSRPGPATTERSRQSRGPAHTSDSRSERRGPPTEGAARAPRGASPTVDRTRERPTARSVRDESYGRPGSRTTPDRREADGPPRRRDERRTPGSRFGSTEQHRQSQRPSGEPDTRFDERRRPRATRDNEDRRSPGRYAESRPRGTAERGSTQGAASSDRRYSNQTGPSGTSRRSTPRHTGTVRSSSTRARDSAPADRPRDAAPRRQAPRRNNTPTGGESGYRRGPTTGAQDSRGTHSGNRDSTARPRRVDRTVSGARDFEGPPQSARRRPSAGERGARPSRSVSGPGGRKPPGSNTKADRARPPRPRGQVSRQQPGASQQRHRPEQKGPARPRRTSPGEGRRPPAERR